MKTLVYIGGGLVVVLLVVYGLYSYFGEHAVKSDTIANDSELFPKEVLEESNATVTAANLQFTYPKGLAGYVVSPDATMSTDPDYVSGTQLVLASDAAIKSDAGVPREGLPAIMVRTYRNLQGEVPSQWAVSHLEESGVDRMVGPATEFVIGGQDAVHYKINGLYTSDVYVVTQGTYVHVFAADIVDENSPHSVDLKTILETVTFITDPTEEV